MKKREFSKIALTCIGAVAFCLIVYSCVIMWVTKDLSPLPVLIGAVFTELSVATGFYYEKAKEENKIKLRQKGGMDDV